MRYRKNIAKNSENSWFAVFSRVMDVLIVMALFGGTLYLSHVYFGLNLAKDDTGRPYVEVDIKFNKSEWSKFVSKIVPWTIQIGMYA